nr:hypothetical protein Iba_chr02aCG20500 [Ipomoea batatas]
MAQEKALASSESTSLSCAKRFSATSTALAAMSGRFILMQATVSCKTQRPTLRKASKNSATLTKSSSKKSSRRESRGSWIARQEWRIGSKGEALMHCLPGKNFCEEDGQKRSALPIRMPPGTMADTSPGTVFLLAAICTDSKTFSTREPSIPCKKKSQCSRMLRNEIDIHFSLRCHRL